MEQNAKKGKPAAWKTITKKVGFKGKYESTENERKSNANKRRLKSYSWEKIKF